MDAVPDSRSHAISRRLNIALVTLFLAVQVVQFFIFPLVLLPISIWWMLMVIPLGLLSLPFWYVIHESFHEKLLTGREANETVGRICSIFFGAPWAILRFGHLMHHAFNRSSLDRPDYYDASKVRPLRAYSTFLIRLCGGLYLVEFLVPLLFFLPLNASQKCLRRLLEREDGPSKIITEQALKQLTSGAALKKIRYDAMWVYLLFALSLIAFWKAWWLFLVLISIRAFVISFADNVPHYGTPTGQVLYAKNLSLPWPIRAIFLHFNLHGLHHRHPSAAWYELPVFLKLEERKFDDTWLHAGLMQFNGPLPFIGHFEGQLDSQTEKKFILT